MNFLVITFSIALAIATLCFCPPIVGEIKTKKFTQEIRYAL